MEISRRPFLCKGLISTSLHARIWHKATPVSSHPVSWTQTFCGGCLQRIRTVKSTEEADVHGFCKSILFSREQQLNSQTEPGAVSARP